MPVLYLSEKTLPYVAAGLSLRQPRPNGRLPFITSPERVSFTRRFSPLGEACPRKPTESKECLLLTSPLIPLSTVWRGGTKGGEATTCRIDNRFLHQYIPRQADNKLRFNFSLGVF